MKRFGLIGYPLGHSFSRAYFTDKFRTEGIPDCRYENFPLERIEEVKTLPEAYPDLQGFNVTIPYKQQVIPYLAETDAEAAAIGAVNTVRIIRTPDGIRMKGYNTDAAGFRQSLLEMLGAERPDALVLGTGGASRAVRYVLEKLGIRYRLVSRRGSGNVFSYEDLTEEIIGQYRLIVNTTPLGTFPDVGSAPDIPYGGIGKHHFLVDLVYNPAGTEFLHRGRIRGAAVKNGYRMLVGQAEAAWNIWNDPSVRL